jgi:hypothetical protein
MSERRRVGEPVKGIPMNWMLTAISLLVFVGAAHAKLESKPPGGKRPLRRDLIERACAPKRFGARKRGGSHEVGMACQPKPAEAFRVGGRRLEPASGIEPPTVAGSALKPASRLLQRGPAPSYEDPAASPSHHPLHDSEQWVPGPQTGYPPGG